MRWLRVGWPLARLTVFLELGSADSEDQADLIRSERLADLNKISVRRIIHGCVAPLKLPRGVA